MNYAIPYILRQKILILSGLLEPVLLQVETNIK